MAKNDGENRIVMEHNLRVARLPIIDYHNVRAVKRRIEEYMDLCEEDDARATVAGLALALGVTRQTLFYWQNGKLKQDPEVMAAIERGLTIINAQLEGNIMEGRGNVVGQIFLAKNNFENYTDTKEVVTRVKLPEMTEAQLIEKAKELPGFIDAEYKEVE